ncbi:MAG: glycosyltransferase family 4 protein [Chloroflexi bacterium]|jgi:glycosyltransferase involved in cell wall biosynthesis|nr:glycosyltransferase family 4 protein [Chloroflexota bacterium]
MPKIILAANTDWYLYNFRYALIHQLREQGFDVSLVSPPGDFAVRLQDAGFRWQPWILRRRSIAPWMELISLLDLVRIYRREQPDLVHHHTIKAVLYGSFAAGWAGIPGVVNSISGRGYVFQGGDWLARSLRLMVSPLYRRVMQKNAAAVIFENQADRDYFSEQRFTPPSRAWLIEGVGTDPQRFAPTSEPHGPVIVLMAARTLWDKGVGIFVEAARILRERLKVRMVLVGGPDPGNPASLTPNMLRAWHREGIIEWWGWQHDMERIYAQAHLIALPTMYGEGVPTALIEAAACGRPIIASDIPGCRSVLQHEHNGLLVPPNDPYTLAWAIEELVLDPARRMKMGAAGRQVVLERFTHEKINCATLQVYQHVLEAIKIG